MEGFIAAVSDLLTGRAAPTTYLVHGAMICYAAGFLFRNQVLLRVLVLNGTALYILYYLYHTSAPLWDAIFASSVIGLANFTGLCRIALAKLPIFMGESRSVLDALGSIAPGIISPGSVRTLMKPVDIETADGAVGAMVKDEVPEALYLLIDGEAEIAFDGNRRSLTGPLFLGEISFISGGSASADVSIQPGARYVAWPRDKLSRLMKSNAAIDQSLRALISYDLAQKVRSSNAAQAAA